MKIKGTDFEKIKTLAAVGRDALALEGITRESYDNRDARIPRIGLAKDTAMRYRWDCMWVGTKLHKEFGLPSGYDDSHIDTVLRAVVP